ncbi:hypothetical protein EWM62_11260 [Mucilaginibacter terrigena]|uniref:Uncharacterized protein n=1 Tax=Mucilaginibacter terrigena TaxID=2492395 RepID=A0A4Q5LLY4_9SPHI|nr:hypothetical protein [Mucilaginibacter terrigena]RYU90113.1 hypothetical protein EWM62_11260 [Mucilaginibacter terrigena]
MKSFPVIFIALLLPCLLFGQNRKRLPKPQIQRPSEVENRKAEQNFQCLYINKYSAKERLLFFPFSIASKIQLISFPATRLPDPVYGNDGELIEVVSENIDTVALITPLAPNKFSINYRKVKEEKTLSSAGIDSLTDILYNVGYTPIKNLNYQMTEQGLCYNPRNAILFIDNNGNVTQYIELCFQCKGYYYSSSKTKSIEYCEQKYRLLSTFFTSEGINHGTIEPIPK